MLNSPENKKSETDKNETEKLNKTPTSGGKGAKSKTPATAKKATTPKTPKSVTKASNVKSKMPTTDKNETSDESSTTTTQETPTTSKKPATPKTPKSAQTPKAAKPKNAKSPKPTLLEKTLVKMDKFVVANDPKSSDEKTAGNESPKSAKEASKNNDVEMAETLTPVRSKALMNTPKSCVQTPKNSPVVIEDLRRKIKVEMARLSVQVH